MGLRRPDGLEVRRQEPGCCMLASFASLIRHLRLHKKADVGFGWLSRIEGQ